MRQLPTRDELRVWRAYIETAEAMRAEMGSRLQTGSGLSSGDYAVLLALSEATEEGLRSSELAGTIGWERSRLSHHLARMERRDLIRREDCPTDSRGAIVRTTATGIDLFRAATVPHLRDVREMFVDALTPAQLTALGEIAEALGARLATVK